jgi:hypothetical protein
LNQKPEFKVLEWKTLKKIVSLIEQKKLSPKQELVDNLQENLIFLSSGELRETYINQNKKMDSRFSLHIKDRLVNGAIFFTPYNWNSKFEALSECELLILNETKLIELLKLTS